MGVPLDEQGLWTVPNLKEFAVTAKSELAKIDAEELLPKWLRGSLTKPAQRTIRNLREKMSGASRQLRRVEKMLELYQPFIHDNDYVFSTANIRALNTSISSNENKELGWNIAEIDWRTYWIDVQYPGLKKWSIPLLHGHTVSPDPAPAHPVQLQRWEERTSHPLLTQQTDKEARA